ncbi:MAG: hypothetical protein H6850_03495 [Alphaproteobacteria bacterium]|nr:MAG: hypothetical protein H6850_03495 [Alphaproteobacteria bacterium]
MIFLFLYGEEEKPEFVEPGYASLMYTLWGDSAPDSEWQREYDAAYADFEKEYRGRHGGSTPQADWDTFNKTFPGIELNRENIGSFADAYKGLQELFAKAPSFKNTSFNSNDLVEALKNKNFTFFRNVVTKTKPEVKTWYRKTSLTFHPDRVRTEDSSDRSVCEEIFKLLGLINSWNDGRADPDRSAAH